MADGDPFAPSKTCTFLTFGLKLRARVAERRIVLTSLSMGVVAELKACSFSTALFRLSKLEQKVWTVLAGILCWGARFVATTFTASAEVASDRPN